MSDQVKPYTSFTIVIQEDMAGNVPTYMTSVPEMPGCYATGDTIRLAITNAAETMCDWLEAAGHEVNSSRALSAALQGQVVSNTSN